MAEAEGISPIVVRTHTLLSTIALEDIDAHHVADFIEFFPERINELSAFILEHRPHLVGTLMRAAEKHGFAYINHAWHKPAPAADAAPAPAADQDSRPKLKLKPKDDSAPAPAPAGPVIRVKPNRAASVVAPDTARPFPKEVKP
jgi:hypothetical protein